MKLYNIIVLVRPEQTASSVVTFLFGAEEEWYPCFIRYGNLTIGGFVTYVETSNPIIYVDYANIYGDFSVIVVEEDAITIEPHKEWIRIMNAVEGGDTEYVWFNPDDAAYYDREGNNISYDELFKEVGTKRKENTYNNTEVKESGKGGKRRKVRGSNEEAQ